MHLVSLGVSVLTLNLLSPCVNERVDRWTRQTMRRAERGLGVRVGVRQPMITMTKGHNTDYEIMMMMVGDDDDAADGDDK